LVYTKGEEFLVVTNDYHLQRPSFQKKSKGEIRTIKVYEGPEC